MRTRTSTRAAIQSPHTDREFSLVPSAIRDSVRAWLASTAAILIAVLGGCSTAQPVTYLGHADLQYYKGLATKIDYPTCPDPDNPVAFASQEPRRIRHRQHDQIWDLTLSEATHIALKNNKLIRFREQGSFPRNPLVNNPDQNPSVYDPA